MTRRGCSPSDEPTSGYDLPRLTADVRSVLDALFVKQAHFAGHSMAGTEVMQFARLYPDRVLSAVFIDAAVDPAASWRVWQMDPQGLPKSVVGSYRSTSIGGGPPFVRLRGDSCPCASVTDETTIRLVSPETGEPLVVLKPGVRMIGRAVGVTNQTVTLIEEGRGNSITMPLGSIGRLEVSELAGTYCAGFSWDLLFSI